jgi:hypothetical protein
MRLSPSSVTACLVTRGDQPEMMERIRDSLIFDDVVIWDNSVNPDWKCAGRYMAMTLAQRSVVYFQDDDVIVPRETQQRLVDAYIPGVMVANWGHGENTDGYDDLPLVCGGAIVDRDLPWKALERYLEEFPLDEGFMYEADFIAGVLYEDFRHLHLPFEIEMSVAQHPSRLCNQSWQRDLKLEIANRARAIRDGALVPA